MEIERTALLVEEVAAARPVLPEESGGIGVCRVAEAEVRDGAAVGDEIDVHPLSAGGVDLVEFLRHGEARRLEEEEAERTPVAEGGGDGVGVRLLSVGDVGDLLEAVPGVLVVVAVRRAACEEERVAVPVRVAERERHGVGRLLRHAHRARRLVEADGARERVGAKFRALGERRVGERAVPDAHFVVLRLRVDVGGVERVADVERVGAELGNRPALHDRPAVADDAPRRGVALRPVDHRVAVAHVAVRHRDVPLRVEREAAERVVDGKERGSAPLDLEGVLSGVCAAHPAEEDAVRFAAAHVEHAGVVLRGGRRRPDFERHAVGGQDVAAGAELHVAAVGAVACLVLRAAHLDGRVVVRPGELGALARGGGTAGERVVVVAAEAPALVQVDVGVVDGRRDLDRLRQGVRTGRRVRVELRVGERAVPDAHFVVFRVRVEVSGVLRVAEVEYRPVQCAERPVRGIAGAGLLYLARRDVALRPVNGARAVRLRDECHGDVVLRIERVRRKRVVHARDRGVVVLDLKEVLVDFRACGPSKRGVVLVVRAIVEDAGVFPDGGLLGPDFDRGRAVGHDARAEVERAGAVGVAGHLRDAVGNGDVRADLLGQAPRHLVLEVGVERPAVLQRRRRRLRIVRVRRERDCRARRDHRRKRHCRYV